MMASATFKTKPEKNKFSNKKDTLDTRHKKIIHEFENNKKNLPHLKNQLKQSQTDLEKINNKDKNLCEAEDIKKKADLVTKIEDLTKKIQDIETNKKALNYFSDVHDLIFKYYDNDLRQQLSDDSQVSDNSESYQNENINNYSRSDKLELLHKQTNKNKKAKKIARKRFDKDENAKKRKTIFDFIKKDTNQLKVTENNNSNQNNSDLDQVTINAIDKAKIYDNYLSLIDNDYNPRNRKKTIIHKCEKCGIEKILNHTEGTYVCKKCGEIENIIIESEIPNYKETGNEKPAYPYKRINHLIECLNQLQAKETTDIPDEVYECIKQELKKRKINDVSNLSVTILRIILKKLKLNKYYEHVSHIKSKITGTQAPMLGKNEALIIQMFKMTQEPFEKYRPKERKNYIHYGYLLRKILQLLGLTDLMEYYPLLKSRDKLRILDKIWEKICHDLGWTYYPS